MITQRRKCPLFWALGLLLLFTSSGAAYNQAVIMHAATPFPTKSVWLVETVDRASSCFDMQVSLALSSTGSPHISYYDSDLTALRYAYRSNDGWVKSTVDNSSSVGRDSSLALNTADFPQIAYRDMTNNDLKYAGWNGSSWKIITIGVDDYGWSPSLQIDAADHPHIAYLGYSPEAGTQTPKYGYFNGTNWEFSIIDDVFTSGGISIAIDSSDQPHVSYHAAGALQTAVISATQWLTETVDARPMGGDYVGLYNSIALDSSDNAHISYALYGVNFSPPFPNDLAYAWQTPTGWDFSLPDTIGEVGFFSSLALDSQDFAHISYYGSDTNMLKYASWDGSDWTIEIVDAPVITDGYTSLSLDQDDLAHVAYCDESSAEIKVARRVIFDHFAFFPIMNVQLDYSNN